MKNILAMTNLIFDKFLYIKYIVKMQGKNRTISVQETRI